MKIEKVLHIFFMSTIAIAMSACVPKATEKKAVCGANQAFNSVSRSCYSIVAPNKAPVADNITPASFAEETQSIITLSYSDVDVDLGTHCQITNLVNVTLTQACSCDVLGLCTVGVTGNTNFTGAAQFSYNVRANNMTSNSAISSFAINNINDAPTIAAIAAQTTNEDFAKAVSFTLADVDSSVTCSDVTVTASSDAALIPLANVVISGSGTSCVATITPVANLNGISNITLEVTDGFLTSLPITFAFNVTAVNDAPTFVVDNIPSSVTSFIAQTINEDSGPFAYNFTIDDIDSAVNCAGNMNYTSTDILLTIDFTPIIPSTICTATITFPLNYNGASNITITLDDFSGTSNSQLSNIFIFTVTPLNDMPVISAIGAGSETIFEDNSTSATFTISDVDNTVTCGSSVAITNSNPTLLPSTVIEDNDAVVTDPEVCKVTMTPAADQSSLTAVNLGFTVTDKTLTSVPSTFNLTVGYVDDPPSFYSPIITADTNEGGMVVVGPFQIDEDKGSTDGEDAQAISVSSVTSDNPAILTSALNPLATSAIRIFYDENDNGVEDAGEERNLNQELDTAAPAVDDAHAHSFYLKLYPVSGIAGNANITITINDGNTTSTTLSTGINSTATTSMTVASTAAFPIPGKVMIGSEIISYAGKTATTLTGLQRGVSSTTAVSHAAAAPVTFNSSNSFSFIVHPVAAIHGGWANISAVGIKTDKNGALVSSNDVQCNYNKSSDTNSCDTTTQDCTGVTPPHGAVTPDTSNVLFWDSASSKCYRSESTSKFSWVDVTTTCPITRIFVSPTALTAAVSLAETGTITVSSTVGFPTAGTLTIGNEQVSYTAKTATTFTGLSRGEDLTTIATHDSLDAVSYTANGENFLWDSTSMAVRPVATGKDQYYFDTATKSCYSSNEAVAGTWSWNASPYVPSKVTLTWNAFTVSDSIPNESVQVYGWNVYRREAAKDYDYVNGFLKTNGDETMTISDATVRTFTDTTAVAGKVYYYLVRPVDSTTRHLTISTADVFSEVRILAPVENYAFVHRWMANQEVCNSMHATTEPTHNYQCAYKGPGESTTAPGYYDIEKDMLVDISENGCPYSSAPACDGSACVGIGVPSSTVTSAADGSIYYDRDSGSCWYKNAGTWADVGNGGEILASVAAKKVSSALNPPLVNISKANAELICNNRSTTSATASLGIANLAVSDPPAGLSLPSKKEYIAYSAAPYLMSDSLITDMEQGFSLNIESRCNSTSANGLESHFTDSPIPSTSFMYTLPGSSSSGIRSMYTGSVPWVANKSTETCSSRYGVQDIYGNVAEWVTDSVSCSEGVMTYTTTLYPVGTSTITVDSTAGFDAAGTLKLGTESLAYTTLDGTHFDIPAGTQVEHAAGSAASMLTTTSFVCSSKTGTDFGDYDFLNGVYDTLAVNRYKFDLTTGPYNDQDATTGVSIGDAFLTDWDFREERYSAGKFSFPIGMPISSEISTALSSSPVLSYLLDIGSSAGITATQLHEDGIIINGSLVNDKATNSTQIGSFAQGGSYLSSNRSGRYSSELVPDSTGRPDIGFRCYIPIENDNYPVDDGRHVYPY